MDLMINIEREILRLLQNGGMYRADIFAASEEAENANQVSYALNSLMRAGRVVKGPREAGRGSLWVLASRETAGGEPIVVHFDTAESDEPEGSPERQESTITVFQDDEPDLPPVGFAAELSEAEKQANAQYHLDNPPFSDVYMALDRLEQKVLFAEMNQGVRHKQLKLSVLEKLSTLLEPSIADLLQEIAQDLDAVPDSASI